MGVRRFDSVNAENGVVVLSEAQEMTIIKFMEELAQENDRRAALAIQSAREIWIR